MKHHEAVKAAQAIANRTGRTAVVVIQNDEEWKPKADRYQAVTLEAFELDDVCGQYFEAVAEVEPTEYPEPAPVAAAVREDDGPSEYEKRIYAERAQRAELCRRTADAIVAALNRQLAEDWKPETDEDAHCYRFELVRQSDGLKLWFQAEERARDIVTKWKVHAGQFTYRGTVLHFHEYRRRDAPSLSAGISATKTPEQIARDLTRRILPDAEDAIAQTRAAWDRELERRDAVGFAIDTLRAAYPRLQEPHLNDWDREKGRRGELGAWGTPYIKAKATHYNGRTTVHLELSDLPLETAAAVLALVPNREEVPEPEEEPAEATP